MPKPKRKSPPILSDLGTPERANHAIVQLEPVDKATTTQKRARVTTECVLDWYWKRGLIIDRLYAAGMRFRALYFTAGRSPHVTSSYGERMPAGDTTNVETTTDARSKMTEAMRCTAVANRDVLVSVCGLDEWASNRLELLREALTDLANYWRITDEEAA